ncbi:unnamed protein product, partial [Effrenium voratum]
VLDASASAAALVLNAFSMEDASKLLLAVAKAKAGAEGAGVRDLYERAAEVIPPKLSELSSVQLIKVVLAVTKVEACRPLLEAAATTATTRVSDIQPSQMMLLMQGLLPLGDHPALNTMADNWAASFYEATRLEGLLGPDSIDTRRKELEGKGRRPSPTEPGPEGGRRRGGMTEKGGPDFEKKEKILKKAYKEGGGVPAQGPPSCKESTSDHAISDQLWDALTSGTNPIETRNLPAIFAEQLDQPCATRALQLASTGSEKEDADFWQGLGLDE